MICVGMFNWGSTGISYKGNVDFIKGIAKVSVPIIGTLLYGSFNSYFRIRCAAIMQQRCVYWLRQSSRIELDKILHEPDTDNEAMRAGMGRMAVLLEAERLLDRLWIESEKNARAWGEEEKGMGVTVINA
jgi:hypothetical protein